MQGQNPNQRLYFKCQRATLDLIPLVSQSIGPSLTLEIWATLFCLPFPNLRGECIALFDKHPQDALIACILIIREL